MPTKKKKKYNARFPPARIKKIMQLDEDVGKVAAAVPVIISRALELFVGRLMGDVNQLVTHRGARTISPGHLKLCVHSEPKFDFLKDLVAEVPDLQGDRDDLQGQGQAEATEAQSTSSVNNTSSRLQRQLSNSSRSRVRLSRKNSQESRKRFLDDFAGSGSDPEEEVDQVQQTQCDEAKEKPPKKKRGRKKKSEMEKQTNATPTLNTPTFTITIPPINFMGSPSSSSVSAPVFTMTSSNGTTANNPFFTIAAKPVVNGPSLGHNNVDQQQLQVGQTTQPLTNSQHLFAASIGEIDEDYDA